MIRINDILDKVAKYHPEGGLDIIDRAYIYSAKAHAGQVRLSGEPYLSHPLEVAGMLADIKLDAISVASALLHDVLEDTETTEEEIEKIFGPEVLHIVAGVTKLSKLNFSSAQVREAESIRKMLLAMSNDIRVILIKLADRLHNMRTLQFHKSEEKRRKIAQETLDIYAPIASRLGIYKVKNELENTAFQYLHPNEYNNLVNMVNRDKEQREKYIETVKTFIKKKLNENNLESEVLGRYKHFHSIHHKMISQNLAFEEIYDIIAFRIILDTIPQCYEVLGLLHALWKPIDIKFKDYIGRPKPNMYQSLHTTVIGPYGERIEFQIRTREMDKVAESGIAAHWSYKEGKHFDNQITNAYSWIKNIIENQANVSDPNEFLENVRLDLFPDEVYIFTPNGDIKSLPKGATPIDFAYLIHTEVGNQCVGAKINGRMVPLKSVLKTGNTVEIITSKKHHPSKDWLNFVITVKARSRIRQWIKIQEKERSLSLGREMCDKAFRKYNLNFNSLLKKEEMKQAVNHFGFKNVEDLIASVGYGKITPLQIIHTITRQTETIADEESSLLNKIIGRVKKKKPKPGVTVKGIDDVLLKFGKCCMPVPGEPITGYITRGFGVTIHRVNCINALKMSPERQIEVEWNIEVEETYPVKILVHSFDRVGLLADMAANITKNGANINSVISNTRDDGSVESSFTIFVKNAEHLKKVLKELKKIKMVHDAIRTK